MSNKWLCSMVVVVLFTFQACVTSKSIKESEKEQLENQIAEMDRKIEDLNHKLSVMQFMVDSHQKSIKTLESSQDEISAKQTAATKVEASKIPSKSAIKQASAPKTGKQTPILSESAEMLYNQALSIYKQKDYKKAASLFQAVAENYPGHELSDNSLYWVGECFYAQKDYKGSIVAFKEVINKYPKGSKAPDALLKVGYSYLALGDKTNAKSFLKKVVKQYPFTPAGTKAGEMLKKIETK